MVWKILKGVKQHREGQTSWFSTFFSVLQTGISVISTEDHK